MPKLDLYEVEDYLEMINEEEVDCEVDDMFCDEPENKKSKNKLNY